MNHNLENEKPTGEGLEIASPVKKRKKKKYKGFTLKQRLAPTILLALVAPLTVFVFGPVEVYYNNVEEFSFALKDFIWWNVLFCVMGIALICGVLLPLRKRVFDVAYATVAWLSVMLFVQGSYLNFGLNSLEGDGLGSAPTPVWVKLLNVAIWLCVGAALILAVIFVKRRHRELLRLGFCVLMITVIGMQALTCGVVLLTTDTEGASISSSDVPDKEYVLTYDNVDKVGDTHNVIYFVIDRFDWEYYEAAREHCPEIFYHVDGGGFTYFDDATSLYPRTFPSIPYMFSGVETDFTASRLDYFATAYTESPFLKEMKKAGYTVNFYSDSYYGYDNAYFLKDTVSNASGNEGYSIDSRLGLSADMMRLSLYRYLPTVAKGAVGHISTPSFEKHVIYNATGDKYTTDMRDLYNHLGENPLQISGDGEKTFSFIHLSGTHTPLPYDQNFNPIGEGHPERHDRMSAMKQSFKIINRYLDMMKELGVFEDATVIITGDHASIGSDDREPLMWAYVTPLFVKPAGVAEGALSVSGAPVYHGDLFATIVKSEGIVTDVDFGRSVFEFSEGEARVRPFYFQRYDRVDGKVNYEQFVYEIHGEASVYDNWVQAERYYLGKNIYD